MEHLRHSSGSLVYQLAGDDVESTASFSLGHSSSKITLDVYTHEPKDQAQRTAAILAEGIYRCAETLTLLH